MAAKFRDLGSFREIQLQLLALIGSFLRAFQGQRAELEQQQVLVSLVPRHQPSRLES